MKSPTIPAVRVEAEQRVDQARFTARGLASLEAAKRDGHYVTAEEVVRGLKARLAAARTRQTTAR